MDDELKRYLTDMMKQINDGNERVLDRLTRIEGEVRDLRSEHSVTRDVVLKLPGTVLGAIEAPLLKRIRTTEDRIDKLEGGADERPDRGRTQAGTDEGRSVVEDPTEQLGSAAGLGDDPAGRRGDFSSRGPVHLAVARQASDDRRAVPAAACR